MQILVLDKALVLNKTSLETSFKAIMLHNKEQYIGLFKELDFRQHVKDWILF